MEQLQEKLNQKEIEVARFTAAEVDMECKLRSQKKEHDEYVQKTDAEIKSFSKTVKIKDKEIHNLTRNVDNERDTITYLKEKTRQFEANTKKLEKKVKQFESKRALLSVSSQTDQTVDTSYTVTDSLQPFFGSRLRWQTKSWFWMMMMDLSAKHVVSPFNRSRS